MPQAEHATAGFEPAPQAEHFDIFRPGQGEGGYNHHSQLVHYAGRFYAMWSNHPSAEDAPGMRVIWSSSQDGKTWTPVRELFPPPGPVRHIDSLGPNFAARGWIVHEERLYALAACQAVVRFRGEGPKGEASFSKTRDEHHLFPAHERYAAFAREVREDGTTGAIFPLGSKLPESISFEIAAGGDVAPAFAAAFDAPYVHGDRGIRSPEHRSGTGKLHLSDQSRHSLLAQQVTVEDQLPRVHYGS